MRILNDHRHELQGPLPAAVPGEAEGVRFKKSADPRVIQELESAVRDRETALRDREARIADLEKSLSWKITAPVRALGTMYLRIFKN